MPKFGPPDLTAWLTIAPLVMQLIDYIVSIVERLFSSKTGVEKKSTAMKIANAVIPSLENGSDLPQGIISKLIDNQVSLNNQAGVFTSSTPRKTLFEPVSIYGI
jgi:hypothetical protein